MAPRDTGMASDPRVSERVYWEVRRRLFLGEFGLRERLDVGTLSKALNASSTPVREALVRLAAERLIASKPTRGFFVSLWSEAELRALYEWRALLLRCGLEQGPGLVGGNESEPYPVRVARLFQGAEAHANAELRRAGANADDRLYMARLVEPEILPGTANEIALLAASLRAGARRAALGHLRAYHGRRLAAVRRLRERAALRALGANGE